MDKIPVGSVPQLTATNYYVWAMKLEAVLGLKKAKYILTTNQPANDAKEREKWDSDNDDVVLIIKLTLSDDQAMQFASETNAKHLWAKIKETYVGRLEDSKIDATVELRNISMGDKETAADYVARARGIASKCKGLGVNISDRELVYYVVRGLNGKFNRLRNTLKTQREKKLDDVLEDLREEERELNNQKKRNDAAYAAKDGKRNAGKKCYVCKKPGHLAKTCWHRRSNDNDDEKKGRQQDKGRGNQRSDAQQQGRSQQNRQDGRNNRNEKANEATDDYAFEADNEDCAGNSCRVSWVLDSGCSSHMIKEKYVANEFIHINGNVFLAGKGNVTKSEGIGSINSRFEIDNKYGSDVCLIDTLFVPELRNNLLSIRKLDELGYKVIFSSGLALIYDNNKALVGKGIKNGSKYIIQSEITVDTCFESIANIRCIDSAMLWHKRLAHLNPKYVDKLIKESLVENANKICKGEIECDSCSMSKLAQKPHKIIEYEVTSKPLELVYVDLCGPMPNDSIKGSRYMMVIVDDYTGMYFVYFLKHKSESLDYFIQFQKKFENRLETKIKSVRTDNGREFINESFRKHLNESGINHQKTMPFNPQSNGKVERANRVLLDRARTILNDSKLPSEFWAEAIATACHVSNLTPRKGKANTPFELFFGRKPSLEHLRVFGCVAFFYVPKQHRNKLEPRGEIGIMVGYARNRSGYRIYDIKNHRIIEERTVKFHENTMGSVFNSIEPSEERPKVLDFESLFEKTNEESFDAPLEKEDDIPEVDVDAESDNDSDITDDENDLFRDININVNRRGRLRGTTKAAMQIRSQEKQRECEAKLLEQGVRRSKRIAGIGTDNVPGHDVNDYEANEINDEIIPNDLKEAKEDNNSKAGDKFIEKLRAVLELNKTTNKGTFLGMEVRQSEKEITISQELYIKTLLTKYGMSDCKPVATPIVPGQDKELDQPDELIESQVYQELVGELLYLSNKTRPDITFATSYLSQFNTQPEKRHYIMAKRILRYLSNTLNYKLHYDREPGTLNGSSDASWGNGMKMKSFSGGVIQLGKSLIMWHCRKQKCVADSTCEAELFAINDLTKNVKWLIGLLSELGFEILYKLPVLIASDSQLAIDVLKEARSSRKLRHVLLKVQFIKDEVAERRVHIYYVNTDFMKADFLTKAVTKEKLVWSSKELNLY
ncbi:uncharacterized protein LOC105835035 isoform X2 [Monomorium pharaonis]|uniref:uncharacterized protein LOC105835035 isoform X2 n=1 Tax=Monomorium pharaonis TaxID=307658 RepID=UPI001745C7B1|nr:uncharacterized protein LOC105835035 isoform X2 [Monomorium pharaonis]